jgi:hypothetical protein
MIEKQFAIYSQFKLAYEKLLSEMGPCFYTGKAYDNLMVQKLIYDKLIKKGTE